MNAKDGSRSSYGSDRGLFVPQFPTIVLILLISVVYFVAGRASLRFAFVHPSATPIWLPTGATLAAFLVSWIPHLARNFRGRVSRQLDDGRIGCYFNRHRNREHSRRTSRRLSGESLCARYQGV